MRYNKSHGRRGVILMVVLALLTLFAIVGISFVLYAESEATAARIAREAESLQRADMDPEQALALFLGQLIYDVNDDITGAGSGLRGHSLARTMYGYNYAALSVPGTNNTVPYNGIGRLHYPNPAVGVDDYLLVNYTWFSTDTFVRDPERYILQPRATPASPQTNPYVGGNASYTYPDLNSFFLAAVKADGTLLTPSYHRKWLFNPNNNFNDMTNPNWTNAHGRYLTLRPRPADNPSNNGRPGFPAPDDATGDVKNLISAPGGNDSIWINPNGPVMTAPDGTKYQALFAPLIIPLDNRVNLNVAGTVLGTNSTHRSNQGWGLWEINPMKVLDPNNLQEYAALFLGNGKGVWGKYGPDSIPDMGQAAPSGRPAHFYHQGDVNGTTDPAPGGYATPIMVPATGTPNTWTGWPVFDPKSFGNGGAELIHHPLLYNVNRPATYLANSNDRVFHASDMESLLRPNNVIPTLNAPVDTGSAALVSDLLRLMPNNLGPLATSPRYRNMVTTVSADLATPGVTPYWSTANTNQYPFPPYAGKGPRGNLVPFPTLQPPSPLPPMPAQPSEFGMDWRASAVPSSVYFPPLNTASLVNGTLGRLNLNRPLPPYPHQGSGYVAPYGPALVGYGMSYATVPNAMTQFTAAVGARQTLANDIYRRLLYVTGANPPANPANPAFNDANFSARRWLAQLAVNMVDFMDEDDISTPFNFYNTNDGLPANLIGRTDGPPDVDNTGKNPMFWVFGTELPRVVVNEAVVETNLPSLVGLKQPTPGEVRVWLELYNPMLAPPLPGTPVQPQDYYRVPLYVSTGGAAGYSPYRISISTGLMQDPTLGINGNVLGKPAVVARPFGASLPHDTNDADFGKLVKAGPNNTLTNQTPLTGDPKKPTLQQPNPPCPNVPGIDPLGFFLIGPGPEDTVDYYDPFVQPNPGNAPPPSGIPYLRTPNMAYSYTFPVAPNDERTSGLTVFLRRLANPYLPYNPTPILPPVPPSTTPMPNPAYNPYVTIDYVQSLPLNATGNIAKGVLPPFASRGKRQPYGSYTALTAPNTTNVNTGNSPVVDQQINPAGGPPGGVLNPGPKHGVLNTFGSQNYPLPQNGNQTQAPGSFYNWLVHLDRQPISPIELLHVSAYPPYQLTQQFVQGNESMPQNLYRHYAPWFDYGPNNAVPWVDPTLNGQSYRLYRLFEFLECGNRASGVDALGRIQGKININNVWDHEVFRAICDANVSGANVTTDAIVDTIFQNLIGSRSPTGGIGPVNMGTGNDDRPFLSLATGASPKSQQYPNGVNVPSTAGVTLPDSIFRSLPNLSTRVLENPIDAQSPQLHPHQQMQLLTKIYNNLTVRSNAFAVFLTVGFFEVTPNGTLGAEIGRSEGRNVRHRMFAIVDRTNLNVFSMTSGTKVTGPTVTNPSGQGTIQLSTITATNPSMTTLPTIQQGTQLVIEPGTANEETVTVIGVTLNNSGVATSVTANFTKAHWNSVATGYSSSTYPIILRGNPGPWSRYDPRNDPAVVLYFSIID